MFSVEIQKLVQSDSSLTNTEVVEKCFGPQHKLNASGKENELLKKRMDELENKCQRMDELENKCQRMDELESKYEQLASVVFGEPTSPPSSTDQ
ncbi:hypothetical protein KY290_024980 [Solanum tuberosum]|uniref:Uncharacterized protein n=1 Tax=Solanum tuberosum TaxID=4113 RepID=A0ABQ7US75_SOLTU|nr:hypothetical protein KY284_023840 [Solanum tuberosum]KAH0754710.1 hypothetical protein KY290_024980 [Solanum tuberosum]